jgi:sarcosine oxidase subunit alpha
MLKIPTIDVAIVGAGPAGLLAATLAAQAGASVAVFERDDRAGGRLGVQSQPLQGPSTIYSGVNGFQHCQALRDAAEEAGATVTLGVEVTAVSPDIDRPDDYRLTMRAETGDQADVIAECIVIATGSDEPLPEFPGADLPGVVLAEEAQVALNVRGQRMGSRVVMAGSDNAGLLIAQNLLDAGAKVIAVVEESTRVVGREFNAAPLRRAGVEMIASARIVSASGSPRLERVHLNQAIGVGDDRPRLLEADTLCIAGPRFPRSGLADQAGCPMVSLDILGGQVPVHARDMATLVPGIFVCGDVSGVESGAIAMESGRLAGLGAVAYLGLRHPNGPALAALARGRLGYLRRGHQGALRRAAKRTLHAAHRHHMRSVEAT